MNRDKVVKSTCRLCSAGCGVLVHIDNGQVVRVEGDPDSPLNQGILCPKGLASLADPATDATPIPSKRNPGPQ